MVLGAWFWLGVMMVGGRVGECAGVGGLGYRQVVGVNGTSPTETEPQPSHEGRQSKVRVQTSTTGFETDTNPQGPPTDVPTIPDSQSSQSIAAGPDPSTQPQPQSQVSPPSTPRQTSTSNAGTKVNDPDVNENSKPSPGQQATPQTTPQPTLPLPPSVLTQNGQTLTPIPESTLLIDDQTLTPGGTITLRDSGVQIHIPPSGGYPTLAFSGRTSTVSTITPAPTVVAGQTLSIRGLPVTLGGTGPSATTLTINDAGTTLAIVNGATRTLAAPLSQTVVFGADITATFDAKGYVYAVNGGATTLKPDGTPVTIDGTRVAVSKNDAQSTVVEVAGQTTTLDPAATGFVDGADGIRVTLVDGSTRVVVGGSTTLAPGQQGVSVKVSGGSAVVVGGRSTTVAAPAGATGTGGTGSAKGDKKENSGLARGARFWWMGVWIGAVALGLAS